MAMVERGHTFEMDNSPRNEEMIDAIYRRSCTFNNNNESEVSDNGLEDISDYEDEELINDDIVDASDDEENKTFRDELKKCTKNKRN
ncbi:Hypothetical predicted protein [Mytilus galloprovincialis]|uniref:Uncharacterized protein n=1 Tax=Mytilus galloprovincialis TaxID=29158 RepID=A0A8B6F3W2_MYTGA|nr:Hypothetical predicted protein [Mytilus galloprovincialis]